MGWREYLNRAIMPSCSRVATWEREKAFPKCSLGIDKSQAFSADLPIRRERPGGIFSRSQAPAFRDGGRPGGIFDELE